jgi:HPt (histidine-containing phosphotransfer) domain-containing protein
MSRSLTAEHPIYSTFGDDPELAEIIEIFVDEFPARIETMQSSFDRAAWDDLKRVAHQLKGAAGSYGFPAITDASGRLEKILRQSGPQAAVRDALEDLIRLCNRARPGRPD